MAQLDCVRGADMAFYILSWGKERSECENFNDLGTYILSTVRPSVEWDDDDVFFECEEKSVCIIPPAIAKQMEKLLGITPGIKKFLEVNGGFVKVDCAGAKPPVLSKFVYHVEKPTLKEVK